MRPSNAGFNAGKTAIAFYLNKADLAALVLLSPGLLHLGIIPNSSQPA